MRHMLSRQVQVVPQLLFASLVLHMRAVACQTNCFSIEALGITTVSILERLACKVLTQMRYVCRIVIKYCLLDDRNCKLHSLW